MTVKEILETIESIRANGACFGIRCTDEEHEVAQVSATSISTVDRATSTRSRRHWRSTAAMPVSISTSCMQGTAENTVMTSRKLFSRLPKSLP